GGAAGDLQYQQEVLIECAARLREVQIDKAPVLRPASCDQHGVDLGRQVQEEPLEPTRSRGVEGRGAQGVEFARGALQALRIPAGEDHLGPLAACSSGRLEPNARATADHDYGLPEQFRLALRGRGAGCGAHDSSTGSAERERKSLHARIEELDLELSVGDGVRLSDQLIQPLLGNGTVALVVDVDSVSSARRLSIDEHAESNGSS